ncbi:hypothetical protein SASPL_148622 [Salvia splendens]|uniref:Uncharacterized protein n=1 Tax=Salvia splendens TaxID=180675 RepID=A0A8X8W9N1_SALSN|nr:hypothetical protein SASPL_148622 [Salvia splendens]
MESDTHSTSHVDNQSYSVLENTVKVVLVVQCQDVATQVYVDEKKKAQAILLGEILGLYQEVDVQPPEVVVTKGSGSKLPSRVEKVLMLKSKPLRQCMKRQEWGHHDSSNCDKFKEKEKRRSRRNSDV